MTTQMHRIVSVLLVALMIGLVAAGWFLVAQPQLAAAAGSADELVSTSSQIAASQASLAQLREKKAKMSDLTTQLGSLQQSIPAGLDGSALVAGIGQQAAAAGVAVKNIAVSDPATYTPAAPSSTTSAAPAVSGGATPTPTPSATASTPSTPSPGFSPRTDPSITTANFLAIPVAISVTGGWGETLAFVKNLQTGTRMYSVTSVTSKFEDDTSGGGGDGAASGYETSIVGYVFAIVDPAKATTGSGTDATPTARTTPTATATHKPAPTGSATPIPSGSSTPSGTPSR